MSEDRFSRTDSDRKDAYSLIRIPAFTSRGFVLLLAFPPTELTPSRLCSLRPLLRFRRASAESAPSDPVHPWLRRCRHGAAPPCLPLPVLPPHPNSSAVTECCCIVVTVNLVMASWLISLWPTKWDRYPSISLLSFFLLLKLSIC
jgi:hypothetical protein